MIYTFCNKHWALAYTNAKVSPQRVASQGVEHWYCWSSNIMMPRLEGSTTDEDTAIRWVAEGNDELLD